MIGCARLFSLFGVVAAIAPDSLRLVNVVYRHGDRSPVSSYPTDPYRHAWPQGLGWLSQVGMRQQFALGQFLRSEYDHLLSSTYNNTEIVVEASNVNRCLMSALCNLAGLYPPHGVQVWDPQLLWQPIPVHTRPEGEDHKLAIEENCPRYNEVYKEELESPAVKEEERINEAFYKMLERESGVQKLNVTDAWMIGDALFVEKSNNLTLPNWTQRKWKDGTVYTKLMDLSNWGFGLLYNGTVLSRLKGGPLLKEFIRNMQKAANDEEYHKMYMYSAHDSTLGAVLDAMQLFSGVVPPYATALLVELHQMEDSYCVKIRYRNDTTKPPFTLVHPNCEMECCPLTQFVKMTKSRVPEDWEAECGNKPNSLLANTAGVVIAMAAFIVVGVAFFIVLLCAYRRQRRIINNFQMI